MSHFFDQKKSKIEHRDMPDDLKLITGQVEEFEQLNYDLKDDVFGADMRNCDFAIAIGLFENKVQKN